MKNTLSEYYLLDRGGDVEKYHEYVRAGQRLGQAFFNALSQKDRYRVVGRPCDPFQKNDADSVWLAIEFLLDTE